MKDPLLAKFIKTRKFKQLSRQEMAVEMHDYSFQKRNFKPFQRKEGNDGSHRPD